MSSPDKPEEGTSSDPATAEFPAATAVAAQVLELPEMLATAEVHSPLGSAAPDHPIFSLIGRVMAEWGYYEHILDQIIWSLARHDQTILACITSQLMGPRPRFLAILALLQNCGANSSLINKVTELSNKSNGTNDERNRFAHDAWFVSEDRKVISRFLKMPKDDLRFGLTPEDDERAKMIIEKIQKRQGQSLDILRDVQSMLASSPKISP